MNKYNYQFEQRVNSIKFVTDGTEHRLRTLLNNILRC